MRALPELTIIVPAYNSATTVGPCLDSIFSQAGPDVEVIVADDGSTDDTDHVASHYPARLVVLPANLGPLLRAIVRPSKLSDESCFLWIPT